MGTARPGQWTHARLRVPPFLDFWAALNSLRVLALSKLPAELQSHSRQIPVFTEIPEQQGISRNTSLDVEIRVSALSCSPHLPSPSAPPSFHTPSSASFSPSVAVSFTLSHSGMLLVKSFKNQVEPVGVKWEESHYLRNKWEKGKREGKKKRKSEWEKEKRFG